MNKQFLRFTLYAIIIYVTNNTPNPAIAASQPLWGDGVHIRAVIDEGSDKRHSDQFLNHHYAQTFAANLNLGDPRTVRLIYFLPNDRPYRAPIVQRMKDEIRQIQTLYSEQMSSHGYGEATFRVETDIQGDPMVHRVDGEHPDRYYLRDTLDTVLHEVDQAFNRDANIYFIVVDNSINRIRGNSCRRGLGSSRTKQGGYALLFGGFSRGLAAHELGHAFGLQHDFHDGAYIMSYGSRRNQLSPCHAEYLSMNPHFNPDIPVEEGQPPHIELISSPQYPAGSPSVPVQLKFSDSEGLHQVILFATTVTPHGAAGFLEVKTCRALEGETEAVVEFGYDGVIPSDNSTNLSNPTVHPIAVAAVDMAGNVTRNNFVLLPETYPPLSKISGDNQRGLPNARLRSSFVIQVRDVGYNLTPRRFAVTFTVTAGDGTLSVAHTETNDRGRARSRLTLGPNLGTNTVEVSVAGIEGTVAFNAVAEPATHIPDPNFRAVVEISLNKAEGEPIAPAEMGSFACLEAPGADIRDLTGLEDATNLTGLDLLSNDISDISPVAGLTRLRWIDLTGNNISDISPVAGLTRLRSLFLQNNNISDISPLIANTRFGNGDTVFVNANPLSYLSIHTHIPALRSRGVTVFFDNQAHPALLKISGDNQTGVPTAPLSQPFVVEAQDENGSPLTGVSVRFAITTGDGTLSPANITTDTNGRAQSTLTLGLSLGRHTVEVSAAGIEGPLAFHAIAETEPPPISADVNSDGNVDIFDLVSVVSEFGNTGPNLAADVNGDSVVDIFDLILVAGMFGDIAAAPAAQLQTTLTRTDLQGWLTDAKNLELRDPITKRGLATLEQLLASLAPQEAELLANYPNPFNPETWIPYRLAEDVFVTLTIYDQTGHLVRTLDVGHQIAAAYESRSKAIHWDGRNNLGEQVANGIYFYTLSAGTYSATRKMLILK